MFLITDRVVQTLRPSLIASLAALLLSACASQKPQQPEPQQPMPQQQSEYPSEQQPDQPGQQQGQQQYPETPTPIRPEKTVEQLQRWTINGKLGVRSPKENGSANLNWQQNSASNYNIRLTGPLGAGATVISGTSAGATLQRGDKPPMQAANPADLTMETLGWPLPVAEMFYWVRGLPAPGSVLEQRNAAGQLQGLEQSGWRLEFSGYKAVSGFQLPTRIKAFTHQAAGPVSVTLVIKQWQPR